MMIVAQICREDVVGACHASQFMFIEAAGCVGFMTRSVMHFEDCSHLGVIHSDAIPNCMGNSNGKTALRSSLKTTFFGLRWLDNGRAELWIFFTKFTAEILNENAVAARHTSHITFIKATSCVHFEACQFMHLKDGPHLGVV